jgi:hypothetical protein
VATQRLMLATIIGESATATARLFQSWQTADQGADPADVDRFCAVLRENGAALPIVYFCEWVDAWLMGDLLPAATAAQGHRFQAACLTPEQAVEWAGRCGHQFPEQDWLASRLREAVGAWDVLAAQRLILLVREVLGGSITDDEVRHSLKIVPDWLRRGAQ